MDFCFRRNERNGVHRQLIVHFKCYSKIREIIKKETLNIKLRRGATVQDALDRLISKYGEELEERLSQRNNWVIMLNDRNINFLDDLKTPLENGDRMAILSPLSGG